MKSQKIRLLSIQNALIAIVLCVVLDSCRNNGNYKFTPNQVTLVQLLLGDGTSQFRKVNMGMDSKTILGIERKKPDENDTNYLFYSFPMDTLFPDSVTDMSDTLNYFTVAYNFDQQKLNEIDEDVFLANDSMAAVLNKRLSDYFTSKYGDGITESDHTIWKLKKLDGKTAKVSLSDESEEYDFGKLSLVYYSED